MKYHRRLGKLLAGAGTALLMLGAESSWAGPVIIDGTDANEHGFASGGANFQGWRYMQSALENLAGQVDPSVSKTVVVLGTSGGDAGAAIDSAFALSSLPGDGWTLTHIDGDADIDDWLDSLSTSNTGLLYIPTASNASGDLGDSELGVINGHGADIADFVNGPGDPTQGGALFTMAESSSSVPAYGWLSSVIPGLGVVDVGGGGVGTSLELTTDGMAAFPGLPAADVAVAIPWHNYFTGNFGTLKVLATADLNGTDVPVILGGGAGTIIDTAEPGILLMAGSGLVALGALRRRQRAAGRRGAGFVG